MKKLMILLCAVLGIQVIHAGDIVDPEGLAKVKIINYVNDPYWENWGGKATFMLSGDVMVSGHGFVYEGQINTPEINGTNVQIRIGLYQNRILKQLSSIKNMKVARNKFNSFVLPFMVKVPGGDYDLRTLIKFPEEDTWKVIMSEDHGINVTYQRFTVYDRPRAPFCKYFAADWELPGDVGNDAGSIPEVIPGELFTMTAKFNNPSGYKLKGKIKVVFERNHKRFLRYENSSVIPEDKDMRIDISEPIPLEMEPGTKAQFEIPCMFKEYINVGDTWTPSCYLYFQSEGSTGWELIPPDTSSYFEENSHMSTTCLGINRRKVFLGKGELSDTDLSHDIKIIYHANGDQSVFEYRDGYLEIEGVDSDTYVFTSSSCPDIDPTDITGIRGGKTIRISISKSKGGYFVCFRGKINRNVKLYF